MPTVGQILASINPPKPPVSRRRRWVKRIASVIIAICISLVYSLWDRHHGRELLDAQIATIRAKSEPITPADFKHAPIPDDRNAARMLLHAADSIEISGDERDRIESLIYNHPAAPSADDLAFAAQIMDRNQRVLEEVAIARLTPEFDWQIQWIHPALKSDLPHLRRVRELATFLSYVAWQRHQTGDDGVAMTAISDLLRLSRMSDDPGTMVSHLVSIGICAMASDRIRNMALTLKVESDNARRQVRNLIAEFLDDTARHAEITRTMQCERMSTLDTNLWLGEQTFLRRGDIDRVTIHMMKDCDDVRQALLAANYPAARPLLPQSDKSDHSRFAALRETLLPSSARAVQTEFRGLTERRIAAIALALRLYSADHGNLLPQKLAPLVPDYLHVVPLDPFASDGREISWNSSPRPLLYSVSENMTDDGIAAQLQPGDEVPNPWKSSDAVFELIVPR